VAIFTTLSEPEVAAFLRDYGLALASFGGIAEGSVNSNFWVEAASPDAAPARWFLRVYEEQGPAGAAAEAELLQILSDRGVPTPAPRLRSAGSAIGTLAGKPAALFPWRSGTMRCTRSVSREDVRQVGEALARVHARGHGLSRGAGRFGRVDLERRLDSIAEAGDLALRALAEPLRGRLAAIADARQPGLPAGLVHGDLFRDNVLFGDDGRLIALLDFESAFHGAFAFDLAVAVLAWTFSDDFDLDLARAMVSGYSAERTLEPAERAALFEEARFASLRFSITRITDFSMRSGEGPRVMKDYKRFLARFDRLTALGPLALERALFRGE
jgi:homoserine kinase type II